MEKYFANYNQSLALKELGFDKPCFGAYDTHKGDEWLLNIKSEFYYDQFSNKNKACIAPLKSQVFEWFREKHGLWVSFGYDEDESEELYWYVDKILECGIGRLFFHDLIEYYTYEEAESACIDKLIEIIKLK